MKSQAKDVILFTILEALSWIYVGVMTAVALPFRWTRAGSTPVAVA